MKHSLTLGYCVLILAQVAISVNVVASKFLLSSLPMFFLLTARFGVSTVLLGGMMLITRTPLKSPSHPEKKLTPYDWFLGILGGLFGATFFNLFFQWGLQHTTATASGIIASSLPAIVAISAIWLLKERLNTAKIIALLLVMFGVLMINFDHFEGGGNIEHTYMGDFLIFLAMIPEAWYSIVGRKLANRITPLGAAFLANLVGLLSFLPIILLMTTTFTIDEVGWDQWALVFLAGLTSVLFFWCWGWGLTFIPATTAAIFGGIMPVAITLLAIIFLTESLHWYDIVGMSLVLLSILIGTGWQPGLKKRVATPLQDS